MNNSDKKQALINLTINGAAVTAPVNHSVIQALWHSKIPRIKGIGCLDGVCGSCRIFVRKNTNSKPFTALACETRIEEGMLAVFPPFTRYTHQQKQQQKFQLTDIKETKDIRPNFQRLFPEVDHCRHCGGCTQSCPKGIDVETGVNLAAKGEFRAAGDTFSECVMCDFCISACPDAIAPSFIGLFSRSVTAITQAPPPNLLQRLEALKQGQYQVETDNAPCISQGDN